MKKILSFGLCFAILCSFAACSQNPTNTQSSAASAASARSAAQSGLAESSAESAGAPETSGVAASDNFVFAQTIAFKEVDGKTEIDLENCTPEIQEKYEALDAIFKALPNFDNIGVGTTSTANLFYELGIVVSAAPESATLNADLTAMQYNAGDEITAEKKVLNVGSALTPNAEAVAEAAPDVFLYSDAMPHNDSYTTMETLNVNLQPLPQSNYVDVILLMQILENYVPAENTKPQEFLDSMKADLEAAQVLVENYAGEEKNAVILQKMPETAYSNSDSSVLGQVLTALNVKNLLGETETSELNLEALVAADPQYLVIYGMGVQPEGLKTFLTEMSAPGSQYETIAAVKEGNAFYVGDDTFTFSSSVDLNITKAIRLVAENIYGG